MTRTRGPGLGMVCWEFSLSLLGPTYLGGLAKKGICNVGHTKLDDKPNETWKPPLFALFAKG